MWIALPKENNKNCWWQCELSVIDFMQGRFHKSPGNVKNTFIKAEDSKTKEGLKIKEAWS